MILLITFHYMAIVTNWVIATEQDGLTKSAKTDEVIKPTVVHVSRPDEVENKRKDLPIIMMEQEIMEAINYHSTVIICGETGCGKTTQVPQVSFVFFNLLVA